MKKISLLICIFCFAGISFAQTEKMTFDNAKSSVEFEKNGKKTKINLSGTTPFGEKIHSVEKVLVKTPAVRMLYSAEKSDEILYPEKNDENIEWEIKYFFDGLYDRIRAFYISEAGKKKAYSGKPYDIMVSYCKYCRTGYCYGKEKSVTVEIIEGSKTIKTFSFDGKDLRNKEKRRDFISSVCDYITTR